ncbi:hypothetical protein ABK045_20195 [Stenotrophomonas pavanii]|uniref:hypothetical protein n=1 Tax=Stenotrophomonas TaxID=40323 RepID=UPI0021C712C8|nr:hypothetical protein [Stenotrophomonas sp. Sm5341]MCU1123533.1 hypothetical protein [Stenotrophomonas maltophilia]MDQ7286961.1 hypothetical protein [Stenotrophomonas sp. Sm5341]
MEFIALKGFNDPEAEGGYQKRGKPWTGPDARAKELRLLGLIGPTEGEGKAAPTPSNKMAPSTANKVAAATPGPGVALVRQKAEKVIAAVAHVTDRATLEDARAAEIAKGEKAREAVLAAIDAALAAMPSSQV